MATQDEIKQVLRDAGEQIKKDLWKPEDELFLQARARDFIGLEAKAAKATDPAKKKAYHNTALDVLNHVKLLALIRAEAAADHMVEKLGSLFVQKALPLLIKLLPALLL